MIVPFGRQFSRSLRQPHDKLQQQRLQGRVTGDRFLLVAIDANYNPYVLQNTILT